MLRWDLLDWSGIFPSSYLVLLTSCIFIIKYAHLEEMHKMETAISVPDAKLELWVWIGHFPSKYWGVSMTVLWDDHGGEAAVEWYEAEKFVLSCYMFLELLKYLVWICWDTYSGDIWKGYLDEIWEAWKGRRIITTWLKSQIVCCAFLISITIPHSSCSIETMHCFKVAYELFHLLILSFLFQGCLCLLHRGDIETVKIQQIFLRKFGTSHLCFF